MKHAPHSKKPESKTRALGVDCLSTVRGGSTGSGSSSELDGGTIKAPTVRSNYKHEAFKAL